ncbi:MAG: serine/threonine-protein kinase [Pirellulaceae bacterium]
MSVSPSSNEYAGSDPDLSGQKLGNYQLLRRLGRGGMADVYLAEQLSLRRQVAFKVLKRSLAEDEAYVRRFHNEARAAASLVHANIVQIHEVGCIDGVHFIAQEYVAGQNLKQWLARHRTADTKTAIHIMRQVVAALSRASQQGIIHRDIKPENIMLAKTGEVKVADFGLARVTTDGQAVNLTQVGVTMGTPLYMSPEQVEGRVVDPRSDLYSLGVTSFEMLAGRPPFEGDTPLSVAVQHLRTEPGRLENLCPDLPEGLCRIVHRLLAKNPAERFQTPAEVMRDLRALHVEGLEQWPAGTDEWDAPEFLAFSAGRSEATLRLESAMKSHAVASRRRVLGGWIGAALVGGVLLGAADAWVTRPTYLLEVTGETVEQKQTAALQYWHAMKLNTEEAWLAVERYFPQDVSMNRVYAWQAKQRLAEFYRDNNQPEKAMRLYSELADSNEIEFAALGRVGKANLLYEQRKKDLATAELGEAAALLGQLPQDEQIRKVLQWLVPDLRATFLEVAQGVPGLEKLSPDTMFE